MDNKLQIFKYTDKEVRTVTKDGEPWFVAKDVCEVLAHSNSRKAIQDHCDSEDVTKGYIGVNTGLGKQNIEVNLVNESGVYSLVFGSILPEAKQFKRWITHEVIPSIRKTGSYSLDKFNIPKDYIGALRLAADIEEDRQRILIENKAMAPKAQSYDKFISAKNSQDMKMVAKVLGWGRNRLFARLREEGVLMSDNMPYQKYVEAGYFEVKEAPLENRTNMGQTYVTPRGVDWLSKRLDSGRQMSIDVMYPQLSLVR